MKLLYKICLFLFVWLSCIPLGYSQSSEQGGPETKDDNLSGFSNDKRIVSKNNWEKYNASKYWSNPEFNKPINDAPCKDCIEVLEKRSENERYFVSLEDPSKYYYQKSYGAINFLKDGNWINIDPKLSKVSDELFIAQNQWDPVGINIRLKNSFISTPYGTVKFNNWSLYGRKDSILKARHSNYNKYYI